MQNILFSVIFLAVAGGCGYFVFTVMERRSRIALTPTSRVKDIQTGKLTEVVGFARRSTSLLSPFTMRPCVFYKYTVERYQRRGKHSSYVTIAQGDSNFTPFIIDDKTAQAVVDPRKANLVLQKNYEFTNGFGKVIEPNLIRFMEENNINYKSWLGEQSMRFREWIITEGEQIYILGNAYRNNNFADDHYKSLNERISDLKNTAGYQKTIDTNQDGIVSEEEWALAVKNIEEKMLDEQMKQPMGALPDVVIAHGGEDMIISDKGQESLLQYYAWQIIGGTIGVLVAITVAITMFFVKGGA
jgi:hypothetical protein